MAAVVTGAPDWRVWGDVNRNVWLWQAVLLAWNLEPRGNESLGAFQPDRWRTVRNGVPVPGASWQLYNLTQKLDELLTIAIHSYGGATPAFPTSPLPNDARWRVVSLGEFGAWAVAQGWEVAEGLPRFAPPAAPADVASRSANGKRWTPEELDTLREYRAAHGTKGAAAKYGISEQRIRELLPGEKPAPRGYSAFNSDQK